MFLSVLIMALKYIINGYNCYGIYVLWCLCSYVLRCKLPGAGCMGKQQKDHLNKQANNHVLSQYGEERGSCRYYIAAKRLSNFYYLSYISVDSLSLGKSLLLWECFFAWSPVRTIFNFTVIVSHLELTQNILK